MYANTTSRRAALVVTLLSLLAVVASLGMLFSAAAGAQSYSLVENSTHNVSDGQTVSVDVEFGDGWYNSTDGTNTSTSATVEIYDNATDTLLGNQTVSVNETEYGDATTALIRTAEFNSTDLGIENETTTKLKILAENTSTVQLADVTVENETTGGGGGGILPAGTSPLNPVHLIVVVGILGVGTAALAAREGYR